MARQGLAAGRRGTRGAGHAYERRIPLDDELKGDGKEEAALKELREGLSKRFDNAVEAWMEGDECVLSTEREPDARKATLYAEKILHERSMSAQQASRLTALRQQAETLRGKEYREEIKLDSDVIPHIRGPRDQNVSRIANEYSLSKVIVDPISCTVRILGSTKESVEAARRELEVEVEEVPVPEDKTAYVIGRGGRNIQEIEQRSGVYAIDLSSKPGQARLIGHRQAIDDARLLVEACIDHLEHTHSEMKELYELRREIDDLTGASSRSEEDPPRGRGRRGGGRAPGRGRGGRRGRGRY